MTNNNFLPAINNIRIYNSKSPESPLILLQPGETTEIYIEFDLTGFDLLIEPISGDFRDFFIHAFLYYANGGIESEVISYSSFHCGDEFSNEKQASFITSVKIDSKSGQKTDDFLSHFYFVELVYSENEPEDGSDLNVLLNNEELRFFRTKLAFGTGDEL